MNLHRQGRLRDRASLGGPTKMTGFRYCIEVSELLQRDHVGRLLSAPGEFSTGRPVGLEWNWPSRSQKLLGPRPPSSATLGGYRISILCRSSSEQAPKQARHMTLIGEPGICSHDLERDVAARELTLCVLDAPPHDIGMWRTAEFGAEFAQEMEHAELHQAGKIGQHDGSMEVLIHILGEQPVLGGRQPPVRNRFAEEYVGVATQQVNTELVF